MNRILGFLVFSLLLILMPSVNMKNTDIYAQEDPFTVFPFKGVYSVGMTVTLFGDVNDSFTVNDEVSLMIKNPSGQTYHDVSVGLNEAGSYTFQFTLEGAEASELGIHTVEATFKSLNANTSFEVKEKPVIEINSDKPAYNLGDVVTISGKVTPRVLDPVEIKIYGFNNTIWKFVPVNAETISSDGTFSVVAGELLGKNVKPGKYRVEASYADNLASAELEFDVSSSGKAVVGNLMAVNQSGEPLEEIFVGQQVIMQADVRNNLDEKQSFAYIVLIKDGDGITISLSWITGTLPASDILSAAQSWVTDEAGRFSVEAFLWESLSTPVPLTGKVPRTDLIVQE